MSFTDELPDALEARLKNLRPAPVSPERMARLRAAGPPAAVPPTCRRRLPLAWAAAAAVLMVALLTLRRLLPAPAPAAASPALAAATPAAAAPADLTAERSEEYVVGARGAGVWSAPDGRAFRVIRCLSVNETVLRDAGRGSELKLIEPRQRVLLLAMGTQ